MTNCKILHLLSGAKDARGLTVIIDVFRAFSLECYLYDLGAALVRPVGSIEEARTLHEKIPGSLLIGERSGIKVEGFDFGNSPSQVEAEKEKIEGKVLCRIWPLFDGRFGEIKKSSLTYDEYKEKLGEIYRTEL